MSVWRALRRLFSGDVAEPRQSRERRPPVQERRLPSDLLLTVAASLATNANPADVLTTAPDGANLQEYWRRRKRALALLTAARRRTAPGAVLVAAALRHEGYDELTVREAFARIGLGLAFPKPLPVVSDQYVNAEVGFTSGPNLDDGVSLARLLSQPAPVDALRVAEAVHQQHPERPEAQAVLGDLYLQADRPADAAGFYQELVNTHRREEFRVRWAQATNAAGRHADGLTIATSAPLASPELELERARALRGLDRPAEALAVLRGLESGAAFNKETMMLERAECEYALGHYLQAVRTARPLAAQGSKPAQRLVGMSHRRNATWDEAAVALGQYLEGSPADAEAWQALAEVQFARGDYVAMLEAAREGVQLQPANDAIASLYGQGLIMNRRYDDAAEYAGGYGKAILPPDMLAVLLIETRQLERAAEHINQWITATRGQEYRSYMAIGALDEVMNNLDEAVNHYAQALALRPNYVPAQEAIRRLEYLMEA